MFGDRHWRKGWASVVVCTVVDGKTMHHDVSCHLSYIYLYPLFSYYVCWSKFDLNSWFSVQLKHNVKLQLTEFTLTILLLQRKTCQHDCPYSYSLSLSLTITVEEPSQHQMWFLKAARRLSLAGVRTDLGIGTQGPKSILVSYHLSDCNKPTDYLIGFLYREWRVGEEAKSKKGWDQMIKSITEKGRLNKIKRSSVQTEEKSLNVFCYWKPWRGNTDEMKPHSSHVSSDICF